MLHTNHCNHPLRISLSHTRLTSLCCFTTGYCIRHSSEDSDYTSSIRTLEQAREWAEIRVVERSTTNSHGNN